MIDEIYNCRQNSLLIVPMSKEWEKLYIKFEAMLTDEQLTMFHKLCDLQSISIADDMGIMYKAGFKDGVDLMIEVQA